MRFEGCGAGRLVRYLLFFFVIMQLRTENIKKNQALESSGGEVGRYGTRIATWVTLIIYLGTSTFMANGRYIKVP